MRYRPCFQCLEEDMSARTIAMAARTPPSNHWRAPLVRPLCMGLAIVSLLVLCHGAGAAEPSDAAVVRVVLSDFSARTDTMSFHEDGVLLIQEQTLPWTKEKFDFMSLNREKSKCPISSGFVDAMVARNSDKDSAAALIPESPRWRVVRGASLASGIDMLDKTPDGDSIKSLAAVAKPAYSDDGNTALVLFHFRWSRHGAMAIYFAQKVDNAWKIACSELLFYP